MSVGSGDPGRSPALFDLAAFRCEPAAIVRLKAMARAHRAPVLSARLRREDEDHAAIERLRRVAAGLAEWFGLRFVAIEAEREGVNGHYGICYRDGLIRIRLRHATTGRLLKESSLVDTLCHELAHLRHFDHSPHFRRFYEKVLAEARRRGDYRPGPEVPRGRQLPLFGDDACGTMQDEDLSRGRRS